MGYRSEVKIVTTHEGYEHLCKLIDKLGADSETDQLLGTEIEPEYREDIDDCVVFGWDCIRWYDGDFEEVTNISKALRELDNAGVPYQFCRVGEDWDDIEFIDCSANGKPSVSIEPSVTIAVYR